LHSNERIAPLKPTALVLRPVCFKSLRATKRTRRQKGWQKPKSHTEARTGTDGEVGLRSFYLWFLGGDIYSALLVDFFTEVGCSAKTNCLGVPAGLL
jgi:hypothetical protein